MESDEHQGGAEKDEERYTFWHGKLADYFEQCRDQQRKAEELPFHLEKVLDNSRLMRAIVNWDTFEKLERTANGYELLRYSRIVGGYARWGSNREGASRGGESRWAYAIIERGKRARVVGT